MHFVFQEKPKLDILFWYRHVAPGGNILVKIFQLKENSTSLKRSFKVFTEVGLQRLLETLVQQMQLREIHQFSAVSPHTILAGDLQGSNLCPDLLLAYSESKRPEILKTRATY